MNEVNIHNGFRSGATLEMLQKILDYGMNNQLRNAGQWKSDTVFFSGIYTGYLIRENRGFSAYGFEVRLFLENGNSMTFYANIHEQIDGMTILPYPLFLDEEIEKEIFG